MDRERLEEEILDKDVIERELKEVIEEEKSIKEKKVLYNSKSDTNKTKYKKYKA
jgi:ethanolamine utilization protein EutQ (cupin superfamily)